MKRLNISFFDRLTYPQKFVLISLLFLLPLAVTIYLLVSELNTRIDHFGWREKYGVEYLRPLRQLMEHVQKHNELTSVHLSEQDEHQIEELPQLQAQIDQDFEALTLVDRQYGAILDTLERPKELKTKWDSIKANITTWDAQENYRQHTAFISDIRTLISYVGDTSYLILDSELDSYYIMDTVVLKLPEAHDLISQLAIVGELGLTRKTLTPAERTQLIVLTVLLKSNLEAINANIQTAFKNSSSQKFKAELQMPLQEEIVARKKFIELLETELIQSSVISFDPAQFHAVAVTSLEASYKFYDAASPVLENLLQTRIDNLSTRRWSILVFAIGVALVAFVTGLAVMHSISQPLSKLVGAAKELGSGKLSTRVQLTTRDEVGQMGWAFNQMAEALQTSQERVVERTRRLEIMASLSDHLSAILNLDELLPEVVNQIQEQFGYYHAHIYLIDPNGEKLLVAAGTGSAGAEMKARGHNIPLRAPTSLVARAARTAEIVAVDNVREVDDWLPNPLLPNTYSEMAVPITLEGRVVGVLDVQQDKIAGLDEGDASLLRSLANHVAVTIRNAHQFAQVQAALAESQAVQEQYVERSWDKTRLARQTAGQVEVRLTGTDLTDNPPSILTTPIKLRQVVIGNLELEYSSQTKMWSENEQALINAVVDQIAQTAESLRLFEETQERAGRETTIREITDKLRAAPTIDSLLETAARELGTRLGVRHTVVELGLEAGQKGQEVRS